MKTAFSDAHLAALEWQVTLWSGEVLPEERQAFALWRAAHPEHARAWADVERMGQRLHAAPEPVARAVLSRSGSGTATRRKVLAGLGALTAGGLALTSMDSPPWQAALADVRTGTGERRHVLLPDGSTLGLNSGSSANLHFSPRERRVHLHAGEVLVTTAIDPRPFIVETAEGMARSLGSRFTVRRLDRITRAQAFEGELHVTAHAAPAAGRRVVAGQHVRFDPHHMGPPEQADPLSAAWEHGLLAVENWTLGALVDELARHRRGVLRCDPAVAGLRVSGVYRLDDPDAVLAALAQALPVAVQAVSRYWVSIGPKNG